MRKWRTKNKARYWKSRRRYTLRDDDSGEFVPLAICGISTIEAATTKAQEAVK